MVTDTYLNMKIIILRKCFNNMRVKQSALEIITNFSFFYFFSAVLGFELRALCLLGSTLPLDLPNLQPFYALVIFQIESHVFAQDWLLSQLGSQVSTTTPGLLVEIESC
jgi:hypothetical protein